MQILTADIDDIDAIVSFYRQYDFAIQKRAWLEWKFFRNPVGPATMYKVLMDGRIVGAVNVIPQRFWLRGRPIYALQAVDGLMGHEIRGTGVFNTLMAHVLATPPPQRDHAHFFMGFVTLQASAKALRHAGWTPVASSSLYSYLLNPNPLKKLRNIGHLTPLLRPVWAALRMVLFRSMDRAVSIAPLTGFDQGFNTFRPQDRLAGDRSASFLNWRIAENPRAQHRVYAFSVDQRCVGYVVTQSDDRTMEIIEMRFEGQPSRRLARFLHYVHANDLADQVDLKMLAPFDADRHLPGPGSIRRRFSGQMFAHHLEKAGISAQNTNWAATFLDSDW